MASIFCPECGAKVAYTLNKPKFCQTCGQKFGDMSSSASTENEEEVTEEIPTIGGLDYTIEMEDNNITLGDLFHSPINPDEVHKDPSRVKDYKKQTKEELLSQSMAECAPRQQPKVTEDGT